MEVVETGGDPFAVGVQLYSTLQSDHDPIDAVTVLAR